MLISLAALPSLSGCGWGFLTDRATNPVLQENLSGGSMISTLSTTAAHRTAYIRGAERMWFGTGEDDKAIGERGMICPEPPPDVSQAVAASFAAALAGSATAAPGQALGDAGAASLAAGLEKQFSTSVAPLLRRSQGLQYHRDAAFYLCVGWMNGIVSNEKFEEAWERIQSNTFALIKLDAETPQPPPITINVAKDADVKLEGASLGSVIDSLTKVTELLKKVEPPPPAQPAPTAAAPIAAPAAAPAAVPAVN